MAVVLPEIAVAAAGRDHPAFKRHPGQFRQYEVLGEGAVLVQWALGDGSWLRLATNLSAKPLGAHNTGGQEIFSIGSVKNNRLGAWSVVWTLHVG